MRMALLIGLAAFLSACSFGLVGEVTGPQSDMPGCDQAQEFAFIGRTSLDALGLGEFGGPDGGRVGTIWVTAERVQVDMGGPAPIGAPQMVPDATRMICVQWADGSGMSGPVPDNWQPPVIATSATESLPIAPLVVAIVLTTLIGVSFLAFRRERPADA